MPTLRWALLVALVVPLRAEAVLVERGRDDYTPGLYHPSSHDPVTYDTDTGLEWLDLPRVEGTTRSWFLTAMGGDPYHNPLNWGWRYATHGEVCGLFEPRTGPIHGCSGGALDSGSRDDAIELLKYLGVTYIDDAAGIQQLQGIFETGSALVYLVGGDIQVWGSTVNYQPEAPPDGGPDIGHFFVRVPEPSTLLLEALVLMALVG